MNNMKIKSKRNFILGIMCLVLGIVTAILYVSTKETRFIVSFLLLISISLINFYYSFQKKGLLEEVQGHIDERDRYLTMRSSHLLLRIMNYVITCCILIFAIAYGAWKITTLLTIAFTLCAVLCFMFIGYLIVNIWLERRA